MKRTKSQMRRVLRVLELIREGRLHEDAYAAFSDFGANRRYHNCETMATELEVSSRTIQRDIDFLRDELGAPLEYSVQGNGYYLTEESYSIGCGLVSEKQLSGVLMAEAVLSAMGFGAVAKDVKTVVDQAFMACGTSVESRRAEVAKHVPFHTKTSCPDSVWEAIQCGLVQSKSLYLTLVASARDRETIEFQPYRLCSEAGDWYLLGRRSFMGTAHSPYKILLSQIASARVLERPSSTAGRERAEPSAMARGEAAREGPAVWGVAA